MPPSAPGMRDAPSAPWRRCLACPPLTPDSVGACDSRTCRDPGVRKGPLRWLSEDRLCTQSPRNKLCRSLREKRDFSLWVNQRSGGKAGEAGTKVRPNQRRMLLLVCEVSRSGGCCGEGGTEDSRRVNSGQKEAGLMLWKEERL